MKYETIKEGQLLRIVALKDFADVNAGDTGGLIESESNLDQHGTCWVYKDARVTGDAFVYKNAKVGGHSKVSGFALIGGEAHIDERATVCDGAEIKGDAIVCGEAQVYGYASISGRSKVYGNAKVHGEALLHKGAEAYGYANITTELTGRAIIIEGFGPLVTITDRYMQVGDKVVEFTDRSFLETKLMELLKGL
jgi:NDP-sugar pyrophosphorylase family protein